MFYQTNRTQAAS